MPYDQFPWFKGQSRQRVCHIEEPSPGHFYWPDLDVDITEVMIEHPEAISRNSAGVMKYPKALVRFSAV